jgi:hypothetical protein
MRQSYVISPFVIATLSVHPELAPSFDVSIISTWAELDSFLKQLRLPLGYHHVHRRLLRPRITAMAPLERQERRGFARFQELSRGPPRSRAHLCVCLYYGYINCSHLFSREEHYQCLKQVELDKTLPSSWWAMFTRYKKRSFASALVTFNNQISGIQVVTNYGVTIYAVCWFLLRASVLKLQIGRWTDWQYPSGH